MTQIVVEISDGMVKAVLGIPEGIKVLIRDYDTDGFEDGLETDEDGFKYFGTTYVSREGLTPVN